MQCRPHRLVKQDSALRPAIMLDVHQLLMQVEGLQSTCYEATRPSLLRAAEGNAMPQAGTGQQAHLLASKPMSSSCCLRDMSTLAGTCTPPGSSLCHIAWTLRYGGHSQALVSVATKAAAVERARALQGIDYHVADDSTSREDSQGQPVGRQRPSTEEWSRHQP